MKKSILAAVLVLAAVAVPLAMDGGNKSAAADQPGGQAQFPPLEEGRYYIFAYEFSGDIRNLNGDNPGSVEGEYLGQQRGSWIKVRQTRGETSEKPTAFWINLDRLAIVKPWPRVNE